LKANQNSGRNTPREVKELAIVHIILHSAKTV